MNYKLGRCKTYGGDLSAPPFGRPSALHAFYSLYLAVRAGLPSAESRA